MAVKTKWVTIDVDKLKDIFFVMDQINTAAIRGLIDHEGKDLLLSQLRQEIPHTIITTGTEESKETEKKEKPKTEAPEKK